MSFFQKKKKMSQNDWATILPFGPVTLIFYWPKKFFVSGLPKASPHSRHCILDKISIDSIIYCLKVIFFSFLKLKNSYFGSLNYSQITKLMYFNSLAMEREQSCTCVLSVNIDYVSCFYDFSVRYWNCSEGVGFFVFHFIIFSNIKKKLLQCIVI